MTTFRHTICSNFQLMIIKNFAKEDPTQTTWENQFIINYIDLNTLKINLSVSDKSKETYPADGV